MFNIKNVKLNKFVGGLLIATSFVASSMSTASNIYGAEPNEIGIVVNNNEVNLTSNTGKPFVQDNRTFVPVRIVSENLGAEVDWDNTKKSFTITKDGNDIRGFANNPTVTVNGVSKLIDNSPNVVVKQVGSRLYVPIRFVSENLNCDVEYKNRIVYITTGGTIIPVPTPTPTPTIGKLDKKYSDFNNPEQAIKYIADTMPGWNFVGKSQYSNLVQAQSANHANVMVSNEDAIARIVIRGWDDPEVFDTDGVRQRNQINMAETKELLKFYLGNSDGVAVYDAICKSVNENKKFSGTADNGMKLSFKGTSAGWVMTITK